MPTYEYICDACGNEFEKFHSMSAAPIRKCPKCGKLKVSRKISAGGGIIFKGGGFYETDYRSDAYKKSADADKPSEAKTATSDSKGDSKGDAKTDAKPAETKSADAASSDAKSATDAKPAKSDAPAKSEPKPTASKSAAKSPSRSKS